MREFKFFEKGTLDMMDSETYATASFYDPRTLTDDERLTQINERIQIDEQLRNQGILTHEQYMRNRDMLFEQERIRRLAMVNHVRRTDNDVRLFNTTTVTTVNPNWRTKIKMVFQESWLHDPIGVVVVSILATIVTIIGIAKLFGA